MSLDPLFLTAVVAELRTKLRHAAVSKILQPGADDLIFRFWTGRENLRLLISTAPRACRLHLSEARSPNPAAPPRFCQLLRSRLSRLLAITHPPGERILQLDFAGEEGEWQLIAELFGTQPNLILVDSGQRIVDALHRREREARKILPGELYVPPPTLHRIDLATGEVPPIPADRPLRAWLLETITPLSLLLADDLVAAAQSEIPPEEGLERLRRAIVDCDFTPAIVTLPSGSRVLTPLLPDYLELAAVERFTTPSLAAEAFYAASSEESLFSAGPLELERLVRKEIVRLEKRLRQIDAEAVKASAHEQQRQLGDLLLANLQQLRRGMETVTVLDWYADPPAPIVIPLDPRLTPQENAERYFRLQRKGKRGEEHIARRRAETADEIDWLNAVLLDLDEATTPAETAAIREELVEVGIVKAPRAPCRPARSADGDGSLRHALTPNGYRLIWGKNNRGNDQVSTRLTAADDLWFHAHQLPGCHLVLKRDGRAGEIPQDDILAAAALAAGYSRGREDGRVEVLIASGRQVKKPKGARPGLVTVDHFRTVVVPPRRLDGAAGEASGGG